MYKALRHPYRMSQDHHHQRFPPDHWCVGLAAACQGVLGVDHLLQCPRSISRSVGTQRDAQCYLRLDFAANVSMHILSSQPPARYCKAAPPTDPRIPHGLPAQACRMTESAAIESIERGAPYHELDPGNWQETRNDIIEEYNPVHKGHTPDD